MIIRLIPALGVALSLAAAAHAAEFTCPAEIAVTQSAQEVPAGWQSTAGTERLGFTRVEFYLMHPSLKGTLAPDRTYRANDEEREEWKFVRNAGDTFWIACVYNDTTVVLYQELAATVTQCEVRHALLRGRGRLLVKAVACR